MSKYPPINNKIPKTMKPIIFTTPSNLVKSKKAIFTKVRISKTKDNIERTLSFSFSLVLIYKIKEYASQIPLKIVVVTSPDK